jgi:POT family proton-dependent oligopeptide transporter
VWFLSSSLAGYVSGIIASSMALSKNSMESITDPSATLNNYIANFEVLSMLSLVVGVFLLILTPVLKKYLKS